MSFAITHFTLGMTGGLLICLLFNISKLEYVLPFITFNGLWAMVPDLWQFGVFDKQVHLHPAASLFYGHHYLDTVIDTGDSPTIAAISVAVFCLTVLLYSIIQAYRAPNRIRSPITLDFDRN